MRFSFSHSFAAGSKPIISQGKALASIAKALGSPPSDAPTSTILMRGSDGSSGKGGAN
jgi:hypothetical protein